MSAAPSCIKWKRADLTAGVCLYCVPTEERTEAMDELESAGYSVSTGVCRPCIERFHMDSLIGTGWELPFT